MFKQLNSFFKQYISVLCMLMMLVTTANATDIVVSVDRNPVVQNESFKLLFNASESPDNDPDFSPLNEKLKVLNQRKNTKSSWVNGQSSSQITWALDVLAKEAGELVIPSVSFGDDVTAPLKITVVDNAAASTASSTDELFLEVEANTEEAYVQSQILYTVRLYQRVQLEQASLTEPTLENAIVEKLGEDKQYSTQINGVNYSVFERVYAIFPQQSGAINIPPLELTARIVTNERPFQFGSVFNQHRMKTKLISSKGVDVNVLPIPDTFTAAHWLAAKNIHVQQTWSNEELTVPVGEPLTRTLTVLAEGVSSSQLPDLVTEHTSEDIKMYPDQPMLRDQKKVEGVIALREQKVAIIPSKAGEYEIPAISIPWFNTETHQMEMATIPAVTVTAVASMNSVEAGAKLQAAEPVVVEATALVQEKYTGFWMWAAIVLALGWLITIIWMIAQRRNKKSAEGSYTLPKSKKVSLKELRKACVENNAQDAMKALLNWAESQYGTRQINSLNLYINNDLKAEINRLNETLYANKKLVWEGSTLIQLVEENTKSNAVEDITTEPLQALHKI